MNRQGKIDGVLETWLLDGPNEMPARVFEAVFDQVERVPQRRLARLYLRLTEMNPRIRLFAVVATALIAVLVGAMTLNGDRDASVGMSPSPSISAAPSAGSVIPSAGAALPVAIQGRWMGGTRGIGPLLAAQSGSSIVLSADRIAVTPSSDGNRRLLDSLASDMEAAHLRFDSDEDGDGCAVGNVGEYTWSTSPGGRILNIEPLTDACTDRISGLSGTWWKMGCPLADDFCLGDLEPGQYGSQYFDPFVGSGESWSPRFGVVQYTVPEGWANPSDWPTTFQLQPAAAEPTTSINLYANVAVVSDDHCTETPDPTVGRSSQAIADWLASAPGLVATTSETVTVGGLSGHRIDITLDPAWIDTCPFSEGAPIRGVFADGTGFHWTIGPGTRSRLFVLDLGDGRAVLVDIEARSNATDDAFVAEATSVVESFAFEP